MSRSAGSTSSGAVLMLALAASGCGGNPPATGAAPEIRSTAEVARVTRVAGESNALEGFRPAHEAVVEGGECHAMALPRKGVRRLSVFFPSMAEPATVLTLIVDSAGTVLRYNETRGLDAARASGVGASGPTDWTTLSLDYVTGEAMVSGGESRSGGGLIMTPVSEVVASGVFGDLEQRMERAKQVCDRRVGAVPAGHAGPLSPPGVGGGPPDPVSAPPARRAR